MQVFKVSASARSALKALGRVLPVLSVTANGALMSYMIETELNTLSSAHVLLDGCLYERDQVNQQVIKKSLSHHDVFTAVDTISRARTMLIAAVRGL